MTTSNIEKFRLILWKNFRIRLKKKKWLLLEIIFPTLILLFFFTLGNMIQNAQETHGAILFKEQSINLDYLKNKYHFPKSQDFHWQLAYSPKNDVLQSIVQAANKKLKLKLNPVAKLNANELELYLQSLKKSLVGIEFPNALASIKELPKSFQYSLRFPLKFRASGDGEGTWSNNLYPEKEKHIDKDVIGPRNLDEEDGGVEYIREGFLAIQDAISKSFIESIASEKSKNAEIPEIKMKRMPYLQYTTNDLRFELLTILPFVLFLLFYYPINVITKQILLEKQKQLKEVMKVMGIPSWINWLAWFTTFMITFTISIILIIIALKIPNQENISVLNHSNIILLAIFFICVAIRLSTFCFMISVLFKSSKYGIIFLNVSYILLFLPYIINSDTNNVRTKFIYSIFVSSGLGFASREIMELEQNGEGLLWSNLFRSYGLSSVGLILLIMLFTSMVEMLLILYIEQVRPGHYGVPQKLNFILNKTFWKRIFHRKKKTEISDSTKQYTQTIYNEKRMTIETKHLTKIYNGQVVVNNISVQLYENEITVLLGHNGAGKTTIISMLTGMIPLTFGRAIINGIDIEKLLSNDRKAIGFCPQHNVLFDDLTVREHLKFYGRLKGLKLDQIEDEMYRLVNSLQLQFFLETKSKDLSGGMKKKLSICIALCGDSKIIFCDEPSTGMDASARHSLWQLLQTEKKGRTILLTTHYMDEADTIGDKIIIINAGQLVGFGSPFELKSQYGYGYKLICVKKENCDTENITKLLEKYIPDIKIDLDLPLEISYKLPKNYSTIFHEMLQKLEDNLDQLNLEGFGISMATLEEVFFLLGADKQYEPVSKTHHTEKIREIYDNIQLNRDNKLIRSQYKGLLFKKLYAIRYHFLLYILSNLFAIILLTFFLYESKPPGQHINENLPFIKIGFAQYPETKTTIELNQNSSKYYQNIEKYYEIYGNSFGSRYSIERIYEDLQHYILKFFDKNIKLMNAICIIGCTIKSDYIIAWFNNELLHSSPLSLNMIHNAILGATLSDESYKIQVFNKPLPYSFESKINDVNSGKTTGVLINFCFSSVLPFISTLGIFFLVKEQRSGAKLLQLLTGVKFYMYWLIQYLVDLSLWLIQIIVITIVIICFGSYHKMTWTEIEILFLLLFLFGLSIFPLTYLASKLNKEPVTVYCAFAIFGIIAGYVFITIHTFFIPPNGYYRACTIIRLILIIFPQINILNAVSNLFYQIDAIKVCEGLRQVLNYKMDQMCAVDKICCDHAYFYWKIPGIGANIVIMLIVAIVFFLLVLAIECGKLDKFISDSTNSRPPAIFGNLGDYKIDSDVRAEKERVKNLTYGEIKEHSLVLRDVTKFYKKQYRAAVKNISFGIPMSECFGLLGVNGAGKTTLFKIITGESSLSYGQVYITGISIKRKMNRINLKIGYCPQFDGLIEVLTIYQHIYFFCLLNGVPEEFIEIIIETFSQVFGFHEHLMKIISKCSGGTKRKVSTTIALLGKPDIVLLDEPTSGMDPYSRRSFWDIINGVRGNGVAFILTTHNMEECEALCTRLAIMVSGELQCIGSIQYLKNKFAQGLVLRIQLKPDSIDRNINATDSRASTVSSNIRSDSSIISEQRYYSALDLLPGPADYKINKLNMIKFVTENFPNSVLKDENEKIFTFFIPTSPMTWSEIFRIMEENKIRLNFEDYSISQTTLEQVFLELARVRL